MKVLVTGATGFIGGALARRLQSTGLKVTGLGRNRQKGQQLESEGIRFYPAALENRDQVLPACQDQEVIFHCGALSSPWGSKRAFYRANALGTQHVVDGALLYGVQRLIHVSTPSIYFLHQSRLNVRETDALPLEPANEYVRTKLLAEAIVDQAVEQGLFAITFRPRAVYGPGDQAILPRIVTALERKRLPIIGNGDNLADFTYIDNLVDGLMLALEADPALCGRKYNITNDEPVPVWETVDLLCERLELSKPSRHLSFETAFRLAGWLERLYRIIPGSPEPPLTRYSVGVLATSQTLNIDAIKAELGYSPRISNTEGLDRFVQWWRSQRRN